MKQRHLAAIPGGLLVLLLTGLMFSCLGTNDSVAVTELSGYTDITVAINTAISDQSPTVTPNGATGTYAIEPALPTGLSLDTDTGELSGTPSVLSDSTTYTITFTASGNYTGTPTQEITIAVDAPPGAPTIGTLSPGDSQVTVSWTAPTDTGYNGGVATTITGYTVYYSTVQGFTKDNAEGNKPADATDTEIVVDGLTNGTTYYFLVTATNKSGEGEPSEIASVTVPYIVGNTGPAGGIIFYINPDAITDGWTYLEAAASDSSLSIAWGVAGGTLVGTSTAIGTGKANTEAIVSVLTTTGGVEKTTYAAGVCSEYSTTVDGNTFDDWFLPSKDELNELYLQRSTVGGFASNYYWSSSEGNSSLAWLQYFANGTQYSNYKGDDERVRSVRAF